MLFSHIVADVVRINTGSVNNKVCKEIKLARPRPSQASVTNVEMHAHR